MRIRDVYNDDEELIGAIYARVSSVKQKDGISLDDQEQKMLAYAEQHGIEVPKEFHFREAISATKQTRDEYEEIRRLIKDRKINCLIVYSSDRFVRDPIVGKIFRNELRKARCYLHYVTAGRVDIYSPQGELMSTIEDAFNLYWLQMIVRTTATKRRAYIADGVPYPHSTPRFGYRRVGKKGDAYLEVVEEQAAVVRNIFQMAAEGMNVNAICLALRGTPTPGDLKSNKNKKRGYGEWPRRVVYDLLRDEIFAGVWYGNRFYSEETEAGRKTTRQRPREEWVSVQVPAIVSRELWERVQRILDEGREMRDRPHRKRDYLLARLCRCGRCGYKLICTSPTNAKHPIAYYACNSQTDSVAGTSCGFRAFRVEATDAAVWAFLSQLFERPETLMAALERSQAQQRDKHQQLAEQVTDLDELIEKHEKELGQLVRSFAGMVTSSAALKAAVETQMNELARTVDQLKERRKQLEARLNQRVMSDEEVAQLTATLEGFKGKAEGADFAKRRGIIEALRMTFTADYDPAAKTRAIIVHLFGMNFLVPVHYDAGKPR